MKIYNIVIVNHGYPAPVLVTEDLSKAKDKCKQLREKGKYHYTQVWEDGFVIDTIYDD